MAVGVGGAFWAATGEPMAVPAAIGAGALNDSDHLLDYYMVYIRKDPRRLYLLFHAWEHAAAVAIFALVAGGHPVLLAAAAGHAGHLLGDLIANKPRSALTYSLLYRAAVRFERRRLVRGSPLPLSVALRHNIPLWHHVESRLPSKVTQYLGLDR